jgi:hypothetical protein
VIGEANPRAKQRGTASLRILAGQRRGIKEVDEGIWLVSFVHYDLGYFDLEQKTLQPLDDPFGTKRPSWRRECPGN